MGLRRPLLPALALAAIVGAIVAFVLADDSDEWPGEEVELSAVAKGGCSPRRSQDWIGYVGVTGGRRLRVAYSDSGSRDPCGLRAVNGDLTLYTTDPRAWSLDLRSYCVEVQLPNGVAPPERLTDSTTGTVHEDGTVDAPEDAARDAQEGAARNAFRGELRCRRLHPGSLDSPG